MQRLSRPFNSWDAIKLLALFLMFVDHAGHFVFTDETWLRAIGRGAAPIFLFLAGFASSYRFQRDLFGLAVLMTASDFLMTGHLRTQNILVTIIVTRLFLDWLDRKGKRIEHPYQWLIGCIAWLGTMLFMQYGSFGLMFGLCGYVKRRSDLYDITVQRRMLIMTLVIFGLVTQVTFGFASPNTIIMTCMLCMAYWLLSRLEIRPIDTKGWPRSLMWLAKTMAVYSGYIYALHLIALEWITGVPF